MINGQCWSHSFRKNAQAPGVHKFILTEKFQMAFSGSCALERHDLPDRFPSSSTCCRRFSKRVKDDRLRKILESLARHLEDKGLINLEECFIDGTFIVAKKGSKVGKTKRSKGTKLMVIAEASGLPVAARADSANPHEVKLVQAAINEIVTV